MHYPCCKAVHTHEALCSNVQRSSFHNNPSETLSCLLSSASKVHFYSPSWRERTEKTFLWNSPLNKKSQNQSRGKSGLSPQRVNYVSWCKSRKSVRSDAFTGNRHKSRPTQYVYCSNWTCSLPCMLGIWGNFKGLFPCLRFTESGSLWRLTTAVTTFLECLLGWLQWRNPNHLRNERATRAKMPQRSREQIPTPQSVVVVANWSRGVPRRPCS